MNTMTTFNGLRGLIATAIFSALALSFTAVSVAAESADVLSVTVKYGDLNLSSPQGAAALYGRIRAAAETVCQPLDGHDPLSKMRNEACIHQAIVNAVTKVGEPELFAVYNAKNRQPLPITVAQAR